MTLSGRPGVYSLELGPALDGGLSGLQVPHQHQHAVASFRQARADLEAKAAVGARDDGDRLNRHGSNVVAEASALRGG